MNINNFAVVGHPISHTMSPFIHERLFSLSSYTPNYQILDIVSVKDSVQKLKSYDGLNVTIPHKGNIIEILDEIDKKAVRFGSVNTVKNDNGRLKGYTTDGEGAKRAVVESGVPFDKVLILGSGGAARAIAFELSDSGVEIIIAARDKNKAEKITDEMNKGSAISIKEAEESEDEYDLIINATSVGMYPNAGTSPISESLLSRCKAVFDIVYNPTETEFIRLAKILNKKIVYGMDMLVYQAVLAHEIWYGGKFKTEDVENLIFDAKTECARMFNKD